MSRHIGLRAEYVKMWARKNAVRLKVYKHNYYLRNKKKIAKTQKKCYLANLKKYKAYHKQYYLKNKAKIAMRSKKYYEDNKAEVLAVMKEYRVKNAVELREFYKARYKKHKTKILIKCRAYRERNKERLNLWNKRYRLENIDKTKESQRRWRIALRNSPAKFAQAKARCRINERARTLALTDGYIRSNVAANYRRNEKASLSQKLIPEIYVTARREQIKAKRLFKTWRKSVGLKGCYPTDQYYQRSYIKKRI